MEPNTKTGYDPTWIGHVKCYELRWNPEKNWRGTLYFKDGTQLSFLTADVEFDETLDTTLIGVHVTTVRWVKRRTVHLQRKWRTCRDDCSDRPSLHEIHAVAMDEAQAFKDSIPVGVFGGDLRGGLEMALRCSLELRLYGHTSYTVDGFTPRGFGVHSQYTRGTMPTMRPPINFMDMEEPGLTIEKIQRVREAMMALESPEEIRARHAQMERDLDEAATLMMLGQKNSRPL